MEERSMRETSSEQYKEEEEEEEWWEGRDIAEEEEGEGHLIWDVKIKNNMVEDLLACLNNNYFLFSFKLTVSFRVSVSICVCVHSEAKRYVERQV